MKHPIYQFLAQHDLSQLQNLQQVIAKMSDQRINRFAERYQKLNIETVPPHENILGMTDIYPDSMDLHSLRLIDQFSIYARTIYINNPLDALINNWLQGNLSSPYMHMRLTQKTDEFKKQLYQDIQYLLFLKPLVEAEIVVLIKANVTPLNSENLLYASSFYSPEGKLSDLHKDETEPEEPPIPEEIDMFADERLKMYFSQVRDGELKPIYDRPIDLSVDPLTTSDKISFQFDTDPIYWPYHMQTQIKMTGEDTFTGVFSFKDGVTIDEMMFRNWVKDKRKEVIKIRVNRLMNDIANAGSLRAKFMTTLPVSRDLSQLKFPEDTSTQAQVLKSLILELPYFDRATPKSVVEARNNETAFLDFISSMEDAFKQISEEPKSEKYDQRVQEIFRDIMTKPVKKIEQRLAAMQKTTFIDSGKLLFGTLFIVLATGYVNMLNEAYLAGLSGLMGQISLLGRKYETNEEIQEMPSFYYWRATKPKGK